MSAEPRPKIEGADVAPVPPTLWNRLLTLGPGLITGAADDDPSGISTYSVAGASTGLSMLWLALVTTPMMAVVQGMCARIGMVVPFVPALAWDVLFAVGLAVGLVLMPYRRIAEILKWLTLSLGAYIVTAFVVHPHWPNVFENLVIPHVQFSKTWITTAMGVLGTTITPYLFFWQSALEVEEEKAMGRVTLKERKGATDEEIRSAHFDVNIGMLLSNAVMFFIIVTTALTLFVHGKTNIQSAQDAAEALRPLAGNAAYLLFTLGMVGTGLLAIPALAGSSAYVAAEMLPAIKRWGLDMPAKKAPRFYAVLVAGMLAGMVMPFTHLNPITALYWSAVLNGIVSVPLIFIVIRIANDRKRMGKWRNSVLANVWSWLTFVLMGAAAVALFALP
jgi:Mn2+/Fe2+ NRAMP family transporter